ncbi:hypothetical protein [Desulforamulus hydrothermalis]|uniref:hypothetical protein n=1 Tax=Desulforamulus hydrothermalis TaxID=412895 RepID=UPI00135F1647|nr:hypothetical protein [Desulforamulus hydrothermalis]
MQQRIRRRAGDSSRPGPGNVRILFCSPAAAGLPGRPKTAQKPEGARLSGVPR